MRPSFATSRITRPLAGEARTGEEAVQETFTDEWDLTRENELSFSYTQEQLEELNRNCWLRERRLPPRRREAQEPSQRRLRGGYGDESCSRR